MIAGELTRNMESSVSFAQKYKRVRNITLKLIKDLAEEDMCIQPVVDCSPTKWHLAHTTWFFENFLLAPFMKGYERFHPEYGFLFNSYYNTVGDRVLRYERGNMSRPTVSEIIAYREYVDKHMKRFLSDEVASPCYAIAELGINHEQQHQELLLTDVKYVLGHNPLFPPCLKVAHAEQYKQRLSSSYLFVEEGLYEVGYSGNDFCFDNEKGRHKVYLPSFRFSDRLVTNGEYIEFINENGYGDFRHWLADGWDWVNQNKISSPMYWHYKEGEWFCYELSGLIQVDLNAPVKHVSFYEADAFARWAGKRLMTEFEWEVAVSQYGNENGSFLDATVNGTRDLSDESTQMRGEVWEWTNSAYLPYPQFKADKGALGEYNGKFMINQMVLRGGSCATAQDHYRDTYRNFFQPDKQWQFTGIRLAEYA